MEIRKVKYEEYEEFEDFDGLRLDAVAIAQ